MARVFFTIGTDHGSPVEDYCDIRQTIGSSHNSGRIEVSRPHGYQGPYDHQAFTHGIAAYYAKCVADGDETRRADNAFEMKHEFSFESEDAGRR
jgi:hypothetical protein